MYVLYFKYHDYNMYGVWGLHPYEYQTFAELTYHNDTIWNQQILVLIGLVNNFLKYCMDNWTSNLIL